VVDLRDRVGARNSVVVVDLRERRPILG